MKIFQNASRCRERRSDGSWTAASPRVTVHQERRFTRSEIVAWELQKLWRCLSTNRFQQERLQWRRGYYLPIDSDTLVVVHWPQLPNAGTPRRQLLWHRSLAGQKQLIKSPTSTESHVGLAIRQNVTIQGNSTERQGKSLNFVNGKGECVNYGKLKESILNPKELKQDEVM